MNEWICAQKFYLTTPRANDRTQTKNELIVKWSHLNLSIAEASLCFDKTNDL